MKQLSKIPFDKIHVGMNVKFIPPRNSYFDYLTNSFVKPTEKEFDGIVAATGVDRLGWQTLVFDFNGVLKIEKHINCLTVYFREI